MGFQMPGWQVIRCAPELLFLSSNSDIIHQAVWIVKHYFEIFLRSYDLNLSCVCLSFDGKLYYINSSFPMQALFKIFLILFTFRERKS